jgi:nucleotide-binding universal stress UspA family protein
MAVTALLCTDGSELAQAALVAGVALLGPDARYVLVTVAETPDADLLGGTGFTGASVTQEEYDQMHGDAIGSARSLLERAGEGLGVAPAEMRVLDGEPGEAICALAGELPAQVVVLGTRGRGGIKRAVLGSVSDYVVRNSSCTVMVTRGDG